MTARLTQCVCAGDGARGGGGGGAAAGAQVGAARPARRARHGRRWTKLLDVYSLDVTVVREVRAGG